MDTQDVKVGMFVKRVRGNHLDIVQGETYKVSKVSVGWIQLEGREGNYDASKFEIVDAVRTHLKNRRWTILIADEQEFNVVQEWLMENLGYNLNTPYNSGIGYLCNYYFGTESRVVDRVLWGARVGKSMEGTEIKLTFKTSITDIQLPEVKKETEVEIKIRELEESAKLIQAQIADLKQLNKGA